MFNIDTIIFLSFLVANLFVGLYFGRKVTTIKDYAVGKRDFNTMALVATIVATWVGGGMFSNVLQKTYTDGLKFFISDISNCLSFIFCYFLAPRMGEFLGSTSVAFSMGNLYGKKVRTITSIAGLFVSIGFISIQFKVFGSLIGYFFQLPVNTAIIISGIVVIIYSCFGGIRSVTFTDVLQFFTFSAFIPILGFTIWSYTSYGFKDIISDNKLINYNSVFENIQEFFIYITLTLYFALPAFYPAYFQRFAIAKNIFQLRKAFLISALILLIMKILIAMISIFLYKVNTTLEPHKILGYIVDNFSYPGLKGIIIAGIGALIMSTADSHINAGSVIFTSDLLGKSKDKSLLICRISAAGLGIMGIVLAVSNDNILSLMLLSASFYMPIVTVPLIFTILGFRSTGKTVLLSMISGFITVVIWRIFFLDTGIDSVIPGMLANISMLLGFHYISKQEGGWVKVNNVILESIRSERIQRLLEIKLSLKHFNITTFLDNNTPKKEITYVLSGIFALISNIIIIYTVNDIYIDYKNTLTILYQFMLLLPSIFIVYPLWSVYIKLKPLKQILWLITILFLMSFCSSLFAIISNFAKLQLAIFTINVVIIGILVRWKTAILMIILGLFSSIKISKYFFASIDIDINYYNIIYVLLIFIAVIIAFSIPKEKEQENIKKFKEEIQKQAKDTDKYLFMISKYKNEFIKNIDTECIELFTSLNKEANDLYNEITIEKNQEHIIEKSKKLTRITEKLYQGSQYLNNMILNSSSNLKIDLKSYNIQNFVYKEIKQTTPGIDILVHNTESPEEAYFDITLISQIIRFFVNLGTQKIHSNIIHVFIDADILEFDLSFTDTLKADRQGVKITLLFEDIILKKEKLVQVISEEKLQFMNSNLYKILSAHFGSFNIATQDLELKYSITLPLNLHKLRAKKFSLPDKVALEYDLLCKNLEVKRDQLNLKIAKKLLSLGMDKYNISQVTGISLEKINCLKLDRDC